MKSDISDSETDRFVLRNAEEVHKTFKKRLNYKKKKS